MNASLTNSLKVVFMAFGPSPAIGQLPNQLAGSIEECIAIGDILQSTGKSAEQFSISMALFERPDSNSFALFQTEKWLTEHYEILANLDARKIIEFQFYLDPQTGSRIVTIPNTIVRLCGNAGLDIAHQAIRILSKSEFAELRLNKEIGN
jgi:hypothetical protein